MKEDFLLQTDLAKELYQRYAKPQPIFDYHCHLEPELIAENYRFTNIVDLWLAGDHYKWRAMRANGIPEAKITGNASNEEKFAAWAETVEASLGNPLYHWTHLELATYFDIEETLGKDNWQRIYKRANEVLKTQEVTTQQLIVDSNVRFIGTTDTPVDSLAYHQKIAELSNFTVKVAPSFRPDLVFGINQAHFTPFIQTLSKLTHKTISSFDDLLEALVLRLEAFDEAGCLASDHGFEQLVYQPTDKNKLNQLLVKALNKQPITVLEQQQWQSELFYQLGKEYHRRGWVMQIHFGAIRSNNQRLLEQVGPDSGFDSMTDQTDLAHTLNQLLNRWEIEGALPKTILYNLNPMYNDLVACTAANFQGNEEGIKSKIQFGAGWWFNDTKRGMIRQLEALADQGLLMNFVGMLTDSRSFISYTRHDYFRRILCQWVSQKVIDGEFPENQASLQQLIEGICYKNAQDYFSKKTERR